MQPRTGVVMATVALAMLTVALARLDNGGVDLADWLEERSRSKDRLGPSESRRDTLEMLPATRRHDLRLLRLARRLAKELREATEAAATAAAGHDSDLATVVKRCRLGRFSCPIG
ncbi:hypothetical protein BOX15_Mlig019832g1 [Macrostomum lignano]|uniref:Secreted protein n=2 Tax=Macrostomum lignano TaxID=282301 RepID=A0A1I8GIK8_9PLAT|nr:hypothetical protein BOX15_Mlig019832g3 [Macrostomum lignano]PAA58986.1 hypothetical protein BOX15_Mlig019832g2 [Macrostomum lignano]PAA67221.1 hypothetical protein BOX15_Mlig019832g1 [Macrostomum lignano]